MKICVIISEYNPFHNGHKYHIDVARRQTGADFVLCVMSGNFVQRGDAAVLDKYARAKHAVAAGADAVIELPTVFATSNAELFAKGAVKIAQSVGATHLSFGVENGNAEAFQKAATLLLNEPKEVSEKLKNLLERGESYAKARATAWEGKIDSSLLTSPNNTLGVEYAKAVQSLSADIELCPIPRVGVLHDDTEIVDGYASASKIRELMETGETDALSALVPPFVFPDLTTSKIALETAERVALITKPTEEIARVLDCTEGLENALKREAKAGTREIAQTLTGKRYTRARIKRIMLQNLLGIEESFIRNALTSPLYLSLLAASKTAKTLLSALGNKNAPLLARAADEQTLDGVAKRCYELDRFAEDIYRGIGGKTTKKNIFQ